jgi:hypothetical protein
MVVIVDVPEGSAGFTCNDGLVITRLDEGASDRAAVPVSRRCGPGQSRPAGLSPRTPL